MTLDDDKSIYVGGLPYDCTQEDLRRAFDLYGAIVDVKIINDRQVGGKCYGFVTFRNPRSAVDAIMDMNGRKIGGRAVRVNEVHTRGGRPNFQRENFHRNADRDDDWERGRERERDHIQDRDHYLDRNNERFRDRDRQRERETDFERGRDFDRARAHSLDRDRDRDREDDDHERAWERNRDREVDRDMDWNGDRDLDKNKDHDIDKELDKEQQPRQRHGLIDWTILVLDQAQNKIFFLDLNMHVSKHQIARLESNIYSFSCQVKEQLELSIQRREELQKEVFHSLLTIVGEKVEEKQQLVSDLQKKSQKLEDALAAAKKLTSQRHSMLMQLRASFIRAQDFAERLKSSEQELQSLVDAVMFEVDMGEDAGARDGLSYANGQTCRRLFFPVIYYNWRKDAGKIRFFYHISIEKIFDIIRRVGSRFLICHVADGWYLRKFEPLLPWPFPKSCNSQPAIKTEGKGFNSRSHTTSGIKILDECSSSCHTEDRGAQNPISPPLPPPPSEEKEDENC
ncbi:unnamed protein product [Musa hybrid cultivar]